MKNHNIILFSFIIAMLLYFSKENILEKNEYIAKIINVNNEQLIHRGVSRIGSQILGLEILSKDRKNQKIKTLNRLNGSPEYD